MHQTSMTTSSAYKHQSRQLMIGTHDGPPVYGKAESRLPAIHGKRTVGGICRLWVSCVRPVLEYVSPIWPAGISRQQAIALDSALRESKPALHGEFSESTLVNTKASTTWDSNGHPSLILEALCFDIQPTSLPQSPFPPLKRTPVQTFLPFVTPLPLPLPPPCINHMCAFSCVPYRWKPPAIRDSNLSGNPQIIQYNTIRGRGTDRERGRQTERDRERKVRKHKQNNG